MSAKQLRPAPTRVGLTPAEAGEALGMSASSFKRHVQPYVKIVRIGSMRIVPVTELERWIADNATFAGPQPAATIPPTDKAPPRRRDGRGHGPGVVTP